MTSRSNSARTGKGSGSLKDILAPIVAIAALLAFAWFIIYMLGLTQAEEPEWTRAVYLFTGVEAIAFAAAGFLFGREVHRKEAQKAGERADAADKRATEAQNSATNAAVKGNALAEAIRVKAKGQRSKTAPYTILGADKAVEATQADFDELVALANRLFK